MKLARLPALFALAASAAATPWHAPAQSVPAAAAAKVATTATNHAATNPAATKPRVLFLTHSAGFTHGVVRRVEQGKLALAERELSTACAPHFELVASQDCAMLAPDSLATFDAVLFYTTGKLPVPAEYAGHLAEWVEEGGAFCGVHSATDTWYDQPAYGNLIGGYFDGHPWHQEVGVTVEAAGHPIVAHRGAGFSIRDEIYQFRSWSREGKTVLLTLDPDTVEIAKGKRDDGDYALAWCRDVGAGRMFYSALGHRHEVWADAAFQRTLLQALWWTTDGTARSHAKAPAGATVLFDGGATTAFRSAKKNGGDCPWPVGDDGLLRVKPGTGSIETRATYGDFVMHVGFRIPVEDRPQGQGKGNSGVYIQRRYEVQILDSHGKGPEINGCAALYRQRKPDVNVARKPGEWQDYHIRFRAARFGDDGAKTENARLSLWWNGTLVHDDVELPSKTGAGRAEGPENGPILLQDHSNAVEYRNLWILPLSGD